jgi:hypothetical protein
MGRWMRAGWRLPLLACVGLAVLAQPAQANVFIKDRREQRDPTLPIFRSVGWLHPVGVSAGGTAFLVGNCHIATAYHVAFLTQSDPQAGAVEVGPPRVGHTAEFLVGPDPAVPSRFKARTRASVVAFGHFARSDFQGMAGDWAILKLDDCLGKKYGYLKPMRAVRSVPMPAGELMTVGFPSSRASLPGITVERVCKAHDHGPVPGLVGVDCAFESGMSGGPILERQIDGRWLVVGLVQQSMAPVDGPLPQYSMEHRNQMVRVTAFRQALDSALRSDSRRILAERAR